MGLNNGKIIDNLFKGNRFLNCFRDKSEYDIKWHSAKVWLMAYSANLKA